MKLTGILSIVALAAASIVPRSAGAFDAGKTYKVFIINGQQKVDTGKWITQRGRYVDANGYEACAFSARWFSPCGVISPSQLFLDELIVPGYLDCAVNSTLSFPTLIVNSPGQKSSGIDKFQQSQTIENMILTADGQGSAFGIITFNTNLPYPIVVQAS